MGVWEDATGARDKRTIKTSTKKEPEAGESPQTVEEKLERVTEPRSVAPGVQEGGQRLW
jgi:hypothetical protein